MDGTCSCCSPESAVPPRYRHAGGRLPTHSSAPPTQSLIRCREATGRHEHNGSSRTDAAKTADGVAVAGSVPGPRTGPSGHLRNEESPRPDLVVLPGAPWWWAILGSNQRPLPCQGSALPLRQSPKSLRGPESIKVLEGGSGGGDGIRTRVDGFAGRCLASRPPHHRGSRLREYPNGGIPSGESRAFEKTHTRADDEIRTRDPHLGKVMRYHCATSALVVPLSRRRRKLYTHRGTSTKILPVHRACPPSSCGSGRFGAPCGQRATPGPRDVFDASPDFR